MTKYRYIILLVLAHIAMFFSLGVFGVEFNIVDLFGDGFNGGLIYLFNAIAVAGVLLSFSISMLSGRVKGVSVLKRAGVTLLNCFVVVIIGTLLAWLLSRYVANYFNVTVTAILIVLLTLGVFLSYSFKRKRFSNELSANAVRKSAVSNGQIKFGFTHLYSSLLAFIVVGGVYLAVEGNNILFLFSLMVTFTGLLFWKFFKWRGWFLLSFLSIVFVSVSFFKPLIIEYFTTFDATQYVSFIDYGLIFSFVALDCFLLAPLAQIYIHKESIS